MIAREVGKQGHIEFDTGNASLFEAVRRNFHRHRARTVTVPVAQFTVQPCGIGRGVDTAFQRARKTVADGAGHRAAAIQFIECLCNPLAARGFAVGAGDARHP